MKLNIENIVLHDFMWLWLELERQPNAEAMRNVINDPVNYEKYKNIVDHGGKEFLTWLAKLMIAMKEKHNESNINNSNG